MSIDEILAENFLKLHYLLMETKQQLETIEGPRCRFHDPAFNIANHPYYSEVQILNPFARMWI